VAVVVLFLFASVGLRVVFTESERSVDIPRVVVSDVESRTVEEAQATLDREGLLVEVKFSPNEVVPAGVVFDQVPVAGAKVEVGSEVTLVVSDGPAGVTVPDVRGSQGTVAASLLQALGLAAVVQPVFDDVVRPGEVVATSPAAGNRARPGETVTVLVSQGPQPRVVPPIVGKEEAPAMAELGRAGLGLGTVTRQFREGVAPGVVLSTDPPAGTQLALRTPVAVVISGPAAELEVPTLVGLLQSSVRGVVPAELPVQVRTRTLAAGDDRVGRVVEQSVPPGTVVAAGTPVEVVIGAAPAPPPTSTTTTVPGATTTTVRR
jgi:serine/threonine-protein kinase